LKNKSLEILLKFIIHSFLKSNVVGTITVVTKSVCGEINFIVLRIPYSEIFSLRFLNKDRFKPQLTSSIINSYGSKFMQNTFNLLQTIISPLI